MLIVKSSQSFSFSSPPANSIQKCSRLPSSPPLRQPSLPLALKDTKRLTYPISRRIPTLLAISCKSRKAERGLEDAFEETIVAKHSVIFDGCTNTSTWQDGAYIVVPLVRFTLCPTDSCASGSCSSSSVGEYVVDLATFLDSYLEAQLEQTQYKCEQMREQCGCDEDNNYCLYYCYKNYDDDLDWVTCYNQQDEEARWAECERIEVDDDDGNRRLEEGQQEEEEVEYFMGPICGSGGDAIYLSVFSDEDCQYAADDSIYYNLVGSYHPNMAQGSAGSLVSGGVCTSCLEPANADEQNDDDYYDHG